MYAAGVRGKVCGLAAIKKERPIFSYNIFHFHIRSTDGGGGGRREPIA